MSPLRWIQSTGPHWTVILEEVTLDTLTEEGGADGAVDVTKSIYMEERVTLRSGSLTSRLCSYCEAEFFSTSLTQSYSHSDGVVTTLF